MADSGITLRYGTTTLNMVQTVAFEMTTVYDKSGTDQLYTRYLLHCRGILARRLDPGTGTERAPQILARVNHDMMRPRQYLRYAIGGTTILEVGKADTDDKTGKFTVDVANGPKPISLTCPVITPAGIQVEFAIETFLNQCTNTTEISTRKYLTHRWEEREEYDRLGMCTLKTTGYVVCPSNIKVHPDQLRDIVVPNIRKGYQRMHQEYDITADGLTLNYAFEDREYWLPPPTLSPVAVDLPAGAAGAAAAAAAAGGGRAPKEYALEATGSFRIKSNSAGGNWTGHIDVMLKGGKLTRKAKLLDRIYRIGLSMFDRLALTGPGLLTPVNQYTFGTATYENEVTLQQTFTVDERRILNRVPFAGFFAGVVPPRPTLRLDLFDFELSGSPPADQPGIAMKARGNNDGIRLTEALFHDVCYPTTTEAELRAAR